MIEFPCGVCAKAVGINHHAIKCDICQKWIHIKCNKYGKKDYKFHQNNPNETFFCIKCTADNIPFSTLNDNQFEIAVKKGVNYPLEIDVRYAPTAAEQRFFNKLNNAINNHTFELNEDCMDGDDENMYPINCNYYSIDEFESKKFNSDKTFSILHHNIHSIELHIEQLRIILEMLNFKFDFICLSESKIQNGSEPKINIDIQGYQPPVGMSTESTKGGVLLYVRTGLNFIPRNDLTNIMYKPRELESFFIEVNNPKETNNIIGVVYRHPCMNEKLFNGIFFY